MIRFPALFVAFAFAFIPPAHAATMTNKDVESLLAAKMPDEVILQAIATSDGKFDTSTNALIRLKQKGASAAVLKAMMSGPAAVRGTASPAATAPAAAAPAARASGGALNPEVVLMVSEGAEAPMQYIVAGNRTAMRALGLGGVATYAVLRGARATKRAGALPEFIVSVPKNAQASNYVTLANFAVRQNESREVLTGGGFSSYSTGIHPDRIVKTSIEPLENQSRAPEGFVLHRVKAEAPLKPGEYALVLSTGDVKVAGFFAQAANSYYDFGID